MTPSRLILTVVVLALSAIAIGRQLRELQLPGDPPGVREPRPAWGWIGCRYDHVNEILAEQLGLKSPGGVMIIAIVPDSPAERAGLLVRDIIRQMDSDTIDTIGDFRSVIRTTVPGQVMRLTVLRDGEPTTLTITLGSRPIPPTPPPPQLPN